MGRCRTIASGVSPARFARVYPMHFVALILITPVMIYLLRTHASAFETPSAFGIYFTPNTVRISWLANLTLLQPFIPLIWVQDLWNAPSWSIGNEFFFYALFPFFITYVVSHLRTTRRLLLSVVGCLVAQAVLTITFIWLIVNVPLNPNMYMFTFLVVRNPLVRMWEFLFGCILGALFQHYQSSSSMQPVFGALRSRSGRNALLVIGIIGLMGLSVHTELTWTRASLLYYTLISALSLPMFGIIVLVLALRRTFLSSVFENRFIVMLGEASYSFYIIHWILTFWCRCDYLVSPHPVGGRQRACLQRSSPRLSLGNSLKCQRDATCVHFSPQDPVKLKCDPECDHGLLISSNGVSRSTLVHSKDAALFHLS